MERWELGKRKSDGATELQIAKNSESKNSEIEGRHLTISNPLIAKLVTIVSDLGIDYLANLTSKTLLHI